VSPSGCTRRRTTSRRSDRPADGFRGFTIAVNLASYDEVQAVYETLRSVDGVELLEEPGKAFWGGGFSWRDPEGNIWDVAS
jgi:uncharacterized glyoxalase superfamily protein PhnB